jgi:hypothetical protein
LFRAEELCGLSIKPKINDIDLNVLQDYYRKFLNPFVYQYDIIEGKKQSSIQLRFDEANFCHLLGIESIVKYSVPKKKICNYKGQGGWDFIQNSGLCFNDLKKINKSKFKSVKAKFVYFYLMTDIVENPVAVKFKNQNVDPPTKIDCDILFYTKDENAVIHLGIKKDEVLGYYIPKTFFVEKLGVSGIDSYIDKQKKIIAKKKNRIIML